MLQETVQFHPMNLSWAANLLLQRDLGEKLAGRGLWRLDENERACRDPASAYRLAHEPSRLHIPAQSRALC